MVPHKTPGDRSGLRQDRDEIGNPYARQVGHQHRDVGKTQTSGSLFGGHYRSVKADVPGIQPLVGASNGDTAIAHHNHRGNGWDCSCSVNYVLGERLGEGKSRSTKRPQPGFGCGCSAERNDDAPAHAIDHVWSLPGHGCRRTGNMTHTRPIQLGGGMSERGKKVAVMGSGSWGTALGMVIADAGGDVAMWAREPDVVDSINHQHVNERYHPGIELPVTMWASGDPAEVLKDAHIVILAIPAQTLRENLANWRSMLADGAVLVSLMKGIELGTMKRMSEVIEEVAGVPPEQVAVLSGPNLAREVAQRQPAATTVACVSEKSAKALAEAVTTTYFRPYFTTDVVGAEIGGSVKNVIALANGMAVGMGLGENTQASLITRGLAEMSRMGAALGANPMTFQGLAGIGDLIATCTSSLSRNRTFGENLGQGLTVAETIERTNQTCEGVKSCQPILDLAAAHGVEMPITAEVVQVVHHEQDPREAVGHLMGRDRKAEEGHKPATS